MSRDYNSNNDKTPLKNRLFYRAKYNSQAFKENNGMGTKAIKDVHFLERLHYGCIDHLNNSVIPNEQFLVELEGGRVLDFVADSFSLLRLNFITAKNRGMLSSESPAFAEMNIVKSYESPKVKYGEYLSDILQNFNKTYIPNVVGKDSIASYNDYVNHFFNFFSNKNFNQPLTMTKWNTSINSSILDTGVSIMYHDIDYDADQNKVDRIIDDPCFEYLQNITLNNGFSISKQNPNVLVYDFNSPAGSSIRESYGLFDLSFIFDRRYIKTYIEDNNLLYNNINIFYNKYVFQNPLIRVLKTKCGKTTSEYIELSPIQVSKRPFTESHRTRIYAQIRNKEENFFYSPQKLNNIIKKSINLQKKVDNLAGIGYINNMFRDQIWNKDYGYHDMKKKMIGTTQTETQRQQTGGGPLSGGSSY